MPFETGRKIVAQTKEISPNKYPLYHAKKLWMSPQFGLVYLYKALHSRRHLSFFCVAPTRKYTPTHVLLMQNWKPGIWLNFTKPETLLLKRWNTLHVSAESHCSGWPLPVQLLKCLVLITRKKCVAPAHLSSITHHILGQCSSRSVELLSVEGAEGENSSAPGHCPCCLGKPRLLLLPSALLGAKLSWTTDGDPLRHWSWQRNCSCASMDSFKSASESERGYPWDFNDLTACTICIIYVTSIETEMMRYTNECSSGKDMHPFDSSKLKSHRSHNILSSLTNNSEVHHLGKQLVLLTSLKYKVNKLVSKKNIVASLASKTQREQQYYRMRLVSANTWISPPKVLCWLQITLAWNTLNFIYYTWLCYFF